MLDNSYVYLYRSVPTNLYKIGCGKSPVKRMREFERHAHGPARYRFGLAWTDEVKEWQAAECRPYEMLWQVPAKDPRRAEYLLHNRFRDKRIHVEGWRGPEWFKLTAPDIEYILSLNGADLDALVRADAWEPMGLFDG